MQDISTFIQHHPMLILGLAIILIALVIVEFIKQKRNANRISPTQATQLMNHSDAAIIDIRSSDAFLNGHIVNAVSLPSNELPNKTKQLEKFKSRPIVIVCSAGLESPRIASSLMQQGFNAQALAGGMRAWIEAEMPLVKG